MTNVTAQIEALKAQLAALEQKQAEDLEARKALIYRAEQAIKMELRELKTLCDDHLSQLSNTELEATIKNPLKIIDLAVTYYQSLADDSE